MEQGSGTQFSWPMAVTVLGLVALMVILCLGVRLTS